MKALVFWDAVLPPIVKGQRVGEIRLIDERSQPVKTAVLYAENSVSGTFFFKIKQFFTTGSFFMLVCKWALLAATILGLIFMVATRKAR